MECLDSRLLPQRALLHPDPILPAKSYPHSYWKKITGRVFPISSKLSNVLGDRRCASSTKDRAVCFELDFRSRLNTILCQVLHPPQPLMQHLPLFFPLHRSGSCTPAAARRVSSQYHIKQRFPVPGSPVNQKYPVRSARIFFKIWRSISLCWYVRKYSFFKNRPGSVSGEIRYSSA